MSDRDVLEAGKLVDEFMDAWDDDERFELTLSENATAGYGSLHVHVVPKDQTKPCVEWTLTRTEKLP